MPMMIGARDLAFPRINLFSWYLYIAGGVCVVLWAILCGGVDTGWTFYTPYSSLYSNTNVMITVVGAFIAGFSSIFTGFNFIVTIHKMRAPGMTWGRLPLFVWTQYATSFIVIIGTPVVAIALGACRRGTIWGAWYFRPGYRRRLLLFQHLFWSDLHPAVYIMILPSMGS